MTAYRQFINAVNADRWIWTAVAIVGIAPLLLVVVFIVYDAASGFPL